MAGAFDTVDRFFDSTRKKFAKPYADALHELFVARVRNNAPMARDAIERFAKVQRETMGVAEVYGARLALRRAAAAHDLAKNFRREHFGSQTILPRVTLTEALDDMVERTPVTIRRAAERTAENIARLYGADRVVAFAYAADAVVTREAQAFIARALRDGTPAGEAGRALAMSVNSIRDKSRPWAEAYADTVFRTNVNTAVTAGRFRQVMDQDIRSVIPAFRFDAVGDGDTRPNHKAADGLILRVDNPAWNRLAPPLGYRCRCQVSFVSVFELEDMRRVEADGSIRESRVPFNAKPDDGFRHGGRPDIFITDGGAS